MSTRRNFLKAAAGTVAGSALAGAAAKAAATDLPEHAYEHGKGSMMYMEGHSMIGAHS